LRVGPNANGSVTGSDPSSGEFVRPSVISPAARKRSTTVVSWSEIGIASRSAELPLVIGWPIEWAHRSFSNVGTPANAASGSPAVHRRSTSAAPARASSNQRMTTEFNGPSNVSIRSIAASTNSTADTCREATRSAWAVASSQRVDCAIDDVMARC